MLLAGFGLLALILIVWGVVKFLRRRKGQAALEKAMVDPTPTGDGKELASRMQAAAVIRLARSSARACTNGSSSNSSCASGSIPATILTMVAMHQFGTAIGTLNFTRTLYATILVAVCGISLALSPNEACYIPLTHKQGGDGAGLFAGGVAPGVADAAVVEPHVAAERRSEVVAAMEAVLLAWLAYRDEVAAACGLVRGG